MFAVQGSHQLDLMRRVPDNTTVPSLPLQLQNPNLFSTNKVGVQVNNYLITDEALMADPFLLEANKSLRPDNKGFLAVKLNFANCKQSDYVLTHQFQKISIAQDLQI